MDAAVAAAHLCAATAAAAFASTVSDTDGAAEDSVLAGRELLDEWSIGLVDGASCRHVAVVF